MTAMRRLLETSTQMVFSPLTRYSGLTGRRISGRVISRGGRSMLLIQPQIRDGVAPKMNRRAEVSDDVL
jgi:hypothetical protein